MRYDAEHKEETRKRVLKAAAGAIRRDGPFKVGVAQVMAEAGLTHGGFYAHFPSKEDLIAAGIGEMFVETQGRLEKEMGEREGATALRAYLAFYLSPAHRDSRSTGCPLPFLAADAPRLPATARARYAQGVASLTAKIADCFTAMDSPDPVADARSFVAEMVGALSLARADPDPVRSDALLATSRAALRARFNLKS